MKKETVKGLVIIVSVVLLMIMGLILVSIFVSNVPKVIENPRIYENFDDLQFLDEYVIAENQYNDKKIKGYNVVEQKNITIEYEGIQSYFVAYVFENDKDCRDYASSVSGNDYDYTTKNKHVYDISSLWYNHKTNWMFKTTRKGQFLAFFENKVYYVKSYASSKKFEKLINFINLQLPQQFEIKTIEEKI